MGALRNGRVTKLANVAKYSKALYMWNAVVTANGEEPWTYETSRRERIAAEQDEPSPSGLQVQTHTIAIPSKLGNIPAL